MPARRLAGPALRRLVYPRPGQARPVLWGLCRGLRFEAHPESPLDLWLGLFESEIAPHIRRLARPGGTTFDVGSANGYYALACARLTGGRALAIEADAGGAELIRRNCLANPGVGERVDVLHAYAAFESNPAQNCVTLDELVREGRAPMPDLVKVDVEGAEEWVLTGANEILSERRPHVVVETHAPELERECGEMLLRRGYRPLVVTPRRLLPQAGRIRFNRWLVADGA